MCVCVCVCVCVEGVGSAIAGCVSDRQADRQTDRQTDRRTSVTLKASGHCACKAEAISSRDTLAGLVTRSVRVRPACVSGFREQRAASSERGTCKRRCELTLGADLLDEEVERHTEKRADFSESDLRLGGNSRPPSYGFCLGFACGSAVGKRVWGVSRGNGLCVHSEVASSHTLAPTVTATLVSLSR